MRRFVVTVACCLALGTASVGAAGPDFTVQARTDKAAVVIKIQLMEGSKLAEEFPVKLAIRTLPESYLDETWDLEGRVQELLSGITIEVPEKRTQVIDVELEIGVCDSAGTCMPRHVAFQVPVARRPQRQFTTLELRTVRPMRDPTARDKIKAMHEAEWAAEAWIKDDLQAALTQAGERGVPILMVFSTQWCSPCNRLRAEVLHHPERSAELGDLVLASFDPDLASSWEAKTRYRVTGYPTSLLCGPDGELLWRHVGYEDAEQYLAALGLSTAQPITPLEQLQATAEASADPSFLLAVADRHRQRGDAAAAGSWLERLPEGAAVDAATRARVVAFVAQQDADPATGAAALEALLLDQAVTPAVPLSEQIWWWVDLAGLRQQAEDGEGTALAWERTIASAEQLLSGQPTEQAAIDAWEVIAIAATYQEDAERAAAAWSEAADRIFHQIGGTDLEMGEIRGSRGAVMTLIPALARAGRAEEARRIADRAVDTFPKEDTFYLIRARANHRLDGVTEQVLADAATAYRLAGGDSRLRAADAWTAMLVEAGRVDEARAALHEVLDPLVLPEDPDIRTHRYASALKVRLEELGAAAAEEPEEVPESP